MKTSATTRRKEKQKRKAKALAIAAFLKRSKVTKALKGAKEGRKSGKAPSPHKFKPPCNRRGNPLRSYAVDLSRGMPGNEESDP